MRQAIEQLSGEWQRLDHQWRLTSEQWQDLVRHRFEREFMQAFEPEVRMALAGMKELEQLIAKARGQVP